MKIEISNDSKWQQSLTLKIIFLAVMGLFLLVPVELIKSIIRERQTAAEEVRKEIASQWAGEQAVSGPVLNIPVKVFPSKKDAEPYRIIYHVLPETLNANGEIKTEKRHRSIYQAIVYTAELEISGSFIIPSPDIGEKIEILPGEAYFTFGISDNRGIKGNVVLETVISGTEAIPGLRDSEVFGSGITIPVRLSGVTDTVRYHLKLSLSGSDGLNFTPLGKNTFVSLHSSWNSPGFTGKFLPAERSVDDSGFAAVWMITNLNRNFPQTWMGNSFNISADSFGVDFVLQADHYQKSLRSAKYGILFIALTFLALLFAEFTSSRKLHIFHYLLVSFALVLFFSLLNALSEQVGFNNAYLISSFSIIVLITMFLWQLGKNLRPALFISGLLVSLYAFIFILLSMKDYAYLAGNIGLLILLAATMWLSVRLRIFGQGGESEALNNK